VPRSLPGDPLPTDVVHGVEADGHVEVGFSLWRLRAGRTLEVTFPGMIS